MIHWQFTVITVATLLFRRDIRVLDKLIYIIK